MTPELIVGIGGPSCSGKTRLTTWITRRLGPGLVTHLDMDGYHLHGRAEREQVGEYPESLEANDFKRFIADLSQIRVGGYAWIPTYDHSTGQHGRCRKCEARRIILVEGLHAVLINDLVQETFLDLSIYIDPEEDLRRAWKIDRDVDKRGYGYEEALRQIQKRATLMKEFVVPQLNLSDLVLRSYRDANRRPVHEIYVNKVFLRRLFAGISGRALLNGFCVLKEVEYRNELRLLIGRCDQTGILRLAERICPSIGAPLNAKKQPARLASYRFHADRLVVLLILTLCALSSAPKGLENSDER